MTPSRELQRELAKKVEKKLATSFESVLMAFQTWHVVAL